ncbi:MAG: twin-arginine translocase TatA/TatE family subunit [Chloroflexi bacterium]|nr:twin-arginine translocase TatA/TatE family subunit [Chloroflexota bacterium]
MLGSLGWQELLIILVILALLFGASRVASLGGALGRGIREFRSEATGASDGKADASDEDVPAEPTASKPNGDKTPPSS